MKLLSTRLKGHALGIVCVASALLISVAAAHAADNTPAAALAADTSRPAEDVARDADRKPADMIAFAQVKSGQTVIDYFPGKGYFTRIFSTAVGPQGAVYAVTPQVLIDKMKGRPLPPAVSGEAGRGIVHEATGVGATLNVPAKADLVWTSQNYHDIHIWGGAEGAAQLNKAVFDALKPGGVYVVLDHAGAAGLDDAGMAKLHRIDEALVKKEVTAAGFVFDGESKLLRNPADSHDNAVFDTGIRGKTDQFILRFRKPGN
ncbi:class I SAM-dependent methyltransferase [Undibacterium terreum]|uniref:Methyltransferase n=1 Tax=Undibacterium terreum TaxID=1224302 RepID=A0A916U3L4_9BURK|nr:class I SAM-dependent methyltransferase [Undibacterium terreum]GGC58288.1 methyltransferase [Undibacterium terreum]